MDNKNKGLADKHDEEFILNESGTWIDNDMDDIDFNRTDEKSKSGEGKNLDIDLVTETHEPVVSNDIASDENSRLEEDTIKPYYDSFPDRKTYENKDDTSASE